MRLTINGYTYSTENLQFRMTHLIYRGFPTHVILKKLKIKWRSYVDFVLFSIFLKCRKCTTIIRSWNKFRVTHVFDFCIMLLVTKLFNAHVILKKLKIKRQSCVDFVLFRICLKCRKCTTIIRSWNKFRMTRVLYYCVFPLLLASCI